MRTATDAAAPQLFHQPIKSFPLLIIQTVKSTGGLCITLHDMVISCRAQYEHLQAAATQ